MTGAIYTCFSCMAGVFLLLRQDDRVPCVLLGRVPRKCSLQACEFATLRGFLSDLRGVVGDLRPSQRCGLGMYHFPWVNMPLTSLPLWRCLLEVTPCHVPR